VYNGSKKQNIIDSLASQNMNIYFISNLDSDQFLPDKL